MVALMMVPAVSLGANAATPTLAAIHLVPRSAAPATGPSSHSFAFVANFEDGALDGWNVVSGHARVVGQPNYNGEPSLRSTAGSSSSQIDEAGPSSGVVAGNSFLSFQAEVNSAQGIGYLGLVDPSGTPVAVVGAGNGEVFAGPSPSTATAIEPIPSGTAQPAGWTYLTANVYALGSNGKNAPTWVMDVFADRTDQAAASQVPVPGAGAYAAFWLDTTAGTVDYTNTILSTYEIPSTIPGYNNMDGYGQGSGLVVQSLPEFTTLTGRMVLDDWNTPQTGILSFQINAMNEYGTNRSTCKGFFQLGVDLNPEGYLSPWYVPGKNCVAHYFLNSSSPAIAPGFFSPNGTALGLEIQDQPRAKQVFFQIVDTSVRGTDEYWNATVPYSGTEFYGSYTQIEWQPCCSHYSIDQYFLNGTLEDLAISGGQLSGPMALPASYMLPFALDMPPSWNLNYYDAGLAGYAQVG